MFELVKKSKKTKARAGIITTSHGSILTPAFSPVATKASVKGLTPEELKSAGSQVVLANTYHLYLQPGVEVIKEFGGFAPFMKWDGPTITDSGGYQVAFLWDASDQSEERAKSVKITEEGAIFQSHIDGDKHLLTPEKSMEIQQTLGADIIMAFDDPRSFERTLRWEERSFKEWKRLQEKGKNKQALFGIVQGGTDARLRVQSLKFVLQMNFPGFAMGGETIGADPQVTANAMDTIVDLLPDDKPLHTLGLGGGPEGIFIAVERGMDTFDNTGITRMARTGFVFAYPVDGGNKKNKFRIDLNKSKNALINQPISKVCKCYTCQNFTTAYIYHLFRSHEMLGPRLCSIHNIFFINNLMKEIRTEILNDNFEDLKKSWLS